MPLKNGQRIHTRGSAPAKPPIENATALLCTSTRGQKILEASSSIIEKLCISNSDASPNAGNGLWLLSPESDTAFKNSQVITWFSGTVEFFNKDNAEQASAERYTIGLGSTMMNAAQVIISDPNDYNLEGCAHFANHSTRPNCKLDYLRNRQTNSVIAVLLILNQDIIVPQGHALELVFDYANSAAINHGILTACDYNPKPKPINELQGIKSNNHHTEFPKISEKSQAGHMDWVQIMQIAMREEDPKTVMPNPYLDLTLFDLKTSPLSTVEVDEDLKRKYQEGFQLGSVAAAAPRAFNFPQNNSFFPAVVLSSEAAAPRRERKRNASAEETDLALQHKIRTRTPYR